MTDMTKMPPVDDGPLAILVALIMQTLVRAEQLHYHYRDQVDTKGDLQLSFRDGFVRLRVGANGDSLEIENTAWVDPFDGDLDPVNARYVVSHGRFLCVDVSTTAGYAGIIGRALLGIEPRINPPEKLTGVTLRFETATMHVHVEFDELFVSWGPSMPPLGSEG